jgi:hypothetical protein
MPLTASFPGAIKSFSEVTDGVTEMTSTDINPPYAEITAIETELGTDPAGTATDVKTRLERSLSGAGNLQFATASELTISSGAITPTQNWHIVDTEGDAATDDLTTIGSTDSVDGSILFLRQANDARDVILKHNTGNIHCVREVDCSLATANKPAMLIYDSVLEKWLVVSQTSYTAVQNCVNTFSSEQIFSASIRLAYTAVTADTTLAETHYCVDVSASAAARTITLPTAVGINGRVYVIRKSDSSGNAVTIDGNGAEHINDADTKVLAAQYDTATLMSNGVGWIVI